MYTVLYMSCTTEEKIWMCIIPSLFAGSRVQPESEEETRTKVKALYEFTGENSQELSFKVGINNLLQLCNEYIIIVAVCSD